jgi:hypothetical protein
MEKNRRKCKRRQRLNYCCAIVLISMFIIKWSLSNGSINIFNFNRKFRFTAPPGMVQGKDKKGMVSWRRLQLELF